MTYRDVLDRLARDGWVLARTKGSHQVWTRPGRGGRVVVAPHALSADVPKGTLQSIKKQAGWK